MRSLVAAAVLATAGHVMVAGAGGAAPAADSDPVTAGRAIYEQYCASCHGANGQGAANWQERDAQGELPPPAHDATGHTWRHSDAALYAMVSKGWRDPFNKTKRLTMPAFGEVLSPEQIRAATDYLKTLWTDEQRAFQVDESREQPFSSPMR